MRMDIDQLAAIDVHVHAERNQGQPQDPLGEHAGVQEAAVFGIPDPRWGEAVHAVVVPLPGQSLDAEALTAHLRQRIAGYKLPRMIEVRTQPLPKSGAGKPLKNVLREPYWAGQERQVH